MKCFCTSAANDLSCAVTSLQSAHGAVSTTTHQYYTAQHTVLYNTVHRDYTRQDEIQIENLSFSGKKWSLIQIKVKKISIASTTFRLWSSFVR